MSEVSQKPETVFRSQVEKFLDSLPKTKHFSIQQIAINGTPDKIVCCNSRFIAIEIKTNEGVATPLQKHNIQQVIRAGGRGYILCPKIFSEFKRDMLQLSKSKFQ
jgi:hypothetical protein